MIFVVIVLDLVIKRADTGIAVELGIFEKRGWDVGAIGRWSPR
jgi:hypothetical protein